MEGQKLSALFFWLISLFLVRDFCAPMRPGVSTIAKAGKGALRLAGSTITSRETTLEPLGPSLQPGVAAYSDGVLQAEKLAEFVEQLSGETSVST
jgi:hypothetical protein